MCRAELVEQIAYLCDDDGQVARVDAHGTEAGAGKLDRVADALLDVVGVDEERGADAECVDLSLERLSFAVVQQGERVRGGAHGGHAEAAARLEVGRGAEARDVRGTGCGDGAVLIRAARAHLGERLAVRGVGHA